MVYPVLERKRMQASEGVQRRHFHDELSMILVLEGRVRSWLDGSVTEVSAPSLVLIPPLMPHNCRPAPGSLVSYVSYLLDAAWVDSLRLPAEGALVVGLDRLRGAASRLAGDGAAGEKSFAALLEAAWGSRAFGARAQRKRGAGARRAAEFLRERCAQGVRLGDLASVMGLGPHQSIRAFARATGMTPHAYLVNLRLNLAKRLMARRVPLAQVALEAGFHDQSHFTNAFRRHVGMSPGRYRLQAL